MGFWCYSDITGANSNIDPQFLAQKRVLRGNKVSYLFQQHVIDIFQRIP